jgi:hypothetical protein
MKRVTLVLALAALSVPAAAGAAQTSSPSASASRASASQIKIYGTVKAITGTTVTVSNATSSRTFVRGAVSLAGIHVGARVEAEGFLRNGALRLSAIHRDNHVARSVSATAPTTNQPGDDNGGAQSVSPTAPVNNSQPGDDHGRGHGGADDGPNHQ